MVIILSAWCFNARSASILEGKIQQLKLALMFQKMSPDIKQRILLADRFYYTRKEAIS